MKILIPIFIRKIKKYCVQLYAINTIESLTERIDEYKKLDFANYFYIQKRNNMDYPYVIVMGQYSTIKEARTKANEISERFKNHLHLSGAWARKLP